MKLGNVLRANARPTADARAASSDVGPCGLSSRQVSCSDMPAPVLKR